MNGLPTGWAHTTLGQIGTWGSGGTPKSTEASFYGGHIPWIRSGDLPDGPVAEHALTITDAGLASSAAKWVPSGAVLIAMYGATVGRLGVSTYPVTTNQAVASCVVDRRLAENSFLYWYLLSIRPVLIESAQGGAQPNISQEILKRQEFPLPPLPEQRRIVAKLEALEASSKRARADLDRITALVSRAKQAILDTQFLPRGDAQNWPAKRVDQVGEVSLGRQRSPDQHFGPNMRPYVRAANITWNGIDVSDIKEMNFDNADFEQFCLRTGDVLLNEGSGSAAEVGKPAIWRGEIENCCFQNTVLRVRPHHCTSEFLYYAFLWAARSGRFISKTQGVNIFHIGKAGLARFEIPVPPPTEQAEIVRRIESAFAKIDRAAAEAASALKLIDRLDQAILAKAFRGELVPQDPDDEPAAVLLERIRVSSAAASRKRRGRSRQ